LDESVQEKKLVVKMVGRGSILLESFDRLHLPSMYRVVYACWFDVTTRLKKKPNKNFVPVGISNNRVNDSHGLLKRSNW
jgi:hypothetical protein